MSCTKILAGITRKVFGRPIENPADHCPLPLQNRLKIQVVGPDGVIKQTVEHVGNLMATSGLTRLAALIATGTAACSDFVSAMGIGTSTTAVNSTHDALQASTAIVHMSQASLDGTAVGNMTARYVATFASNNPAGAATINEVGLFWTNAASANMIARSVLGTDSINKGASDVINISYDLVAKTAS